MRTTYPYLVTPGIRLLKFFVTAIEDGRERSLTVFAEEKHSVAGMASLLFSISEKSIKYVSEPVVADRYEFVDATFCAVFRLLSITRKTLGPVVAEVRSCMEAETLMNRLAQYIDLYVGEFGNPEQHLRRVILQIRAETK